MKNFVILFAALIMVLNLSGCNQTENINNTDTDIAESTNNSDIEVVSGVYPYWDEIDVPVTQDSIPDSDTAISVTKSIVAAYQKDGMYPDYHPQSVFFDTEQQLWIVTFYPNNQEEGASLSIAIKKENAQVVKMWVGE